MSLQGTRDFFPNQLLLENWFKDKCESSAKKFGYIEYSSSILEKAELYKRDGSDLSSEMYIFTKDGIEMAIRPEMTPTLTRMLMKCHKTITLPARWFSFSQCYRHEATVRGRKREFYQWNVDILGGRHSEIELFSMLVQFFISVGLTSDHVVIKVSDRRIIKSMLEQYEITGDNFYTACNIIDKFNKVSKDEMIQMFKDRLDLKIESDIGDKIYDFIQITSLDELENSMVVDKSITKDLFNIFAMAKSLGFSEWLVFDLSIIRGLGYYTGVVFEGFFKNSELKRAICGGGRYTFDSLSLVGFGMGDVVMMDVLQEQGLLPCLKYQLDFIVIPFSAELFTAATLVANRIRSETRFNAEIYMGSNKLKVALDYSNRVGANVSIIIATEEWKSESVVVKPMTGEVRRQEIKPVDLFIKELSLL